MSIPAYTYFKNCSLLSSFFKWKIISDIDFYTQINNLLFHLIQPISAKSLSTKARYYFPALGPIYMVVAAFIVNLQPMNQVKSNQAIITSLQNGEEETLYSLNRRYFQSARRWLRRKGVPDSATPKIFTRVLVSIFRQAQQKKISTVVEMEPLIFNSINEFLENAGSSFGKRKLRDTMANTDEQKSISAACFSVLDDQARALLSARYVSRLTFEEIAAKFELPNPVAAEFEVDKAMAQYRKIVEARLNPGLD